MPFYEYVCTECGEQTELLQKISDPPATECPACHAQALSKQVSASGFRLKGAGWYETDFKSGGKRNLVGDAKSDGGEAKAGEGKTGEGKTGEGKTGEGKTGEAKTGESKSGETSAKTDKAESKPAAKTESAAKPAAASPDKSSPKSTGGSKTPA